MENSNLSGRTVALGLALSIVCLVNAAIVVVKEKSQAVMAAMKGLTGHHWTAHVLIVLIIFLGGGMLAGIAGPRTPTMSANRLITTIVSSVAVATIVILGFYLFVD